MKQITEGLWQAGIMFDDDMPKEANTIFWMIEDGCTLPWASSPYFDSQIFIRYPIPDDDQGIANETFQRLWALISAVEDRKILAVCQAGENRSGLVCCLVLIARGYGVEEAIKLVQENGNARTHKHSFWNVGFVSQVRKFFS